MNIKVISKSNIVWNVIFFLLLSFLFYHAQLAYKGKYSSLDLYKLKELALSHKHMAVLILITIISVYRVKKYSIYLFLITGIVITFESFKLLKVDFDKMLLVLNSFYIIWLYYFYQILNLELSESFYNPNFSTNEMFDPILLKINGDIELPDGKTYSGRIVNWSESGVFIKLDNPYKIINKKVKVKIKFNSEDFITSAKLVSRSSDNSSYGFKILDNEKKVKEFNWLDLYSILEEMGYHPYVLR